MPSDDEKSSSAASSESDQDWTEVQRRPATRGQGRGKGSANPGYIPTAASPNSIGGGRLNNLLGGRKIYVAGLTPATRESHLFTAFQHCGRITDAKICRHADGSSKSFAFVTFSDRTAADIAIRDGAARIDGVSCRVFLYDANRGSSLPQGDAQATAEVREEIQSFITRNEITGMAATALKRTDARSALKVIRLLSAKGGVVTEGLIHRELQRVAGSNLSKDLEQRATRWVDSLGCAQELRDNLLSVLLAQAAADIEKVLFAAQQPAWVRDLLSKDSPSQWMMSQLDRFRKRDMRGEIADFCQRHGFGKDVEKRLCDIRAYNSRRLLNNYNPSHQSKQDFMDSVKDEYFDFVISRDNARAAKVTTVDSHMRLLDTWSDDEEDVDDDASTSAPPTSSGAAGSSSDETFQAFDADSSRPLTPAQWLGHCAATSSSRGQSDRASKEKLRKNKAKPTHFVLCVDSSGSMVTTDCQNNEGEPISRMDAVIDTCLHFISQSAMNFDDGYSFVTFDEGSTLHFSCQRAFDAQTKVEKGLGVKPQGKTKFSMGIRGIHAAISQDEKKRPARVVFLSDGEPTDPEGYLRDMQKLVKKYPGDSLKIYTVGFGDSAKVNAMEGDFEYLQQLASLGRGHFQRCGASLSSLQGAFTAVTSTITQTRSAGSGGSSRNRQEVASQGSAELCPRPGMAEGPSAAAIATINEDDEDDEDGSADGGEEPEEDMPSHIACQVEFEMPDPKNYIWKRTKDMNQWNEFLTAKTSFSFDGRQFTRNPSMQKVFLRQKPFMKGGMRLVYGMLHEEDKIHMEDSKSWKCAKRLFQDLEKDQGFQSHAAFCKSTAVAQYYGKLFRAKTKMKVGFLDCHLYSPVDVQQKGYHFCGEDFLKGHFVKLNSNAGFVNEAEFGDHSAIAQAFSHFTYDQSKGELMVVDLQGICGEKEDGSLYCLLTDPQVHSNGAYERFGSGDLQDRGFRKFFAKHKCGELCQKLGLRKEYDMSPPTTKFPMPGVRALIQHMLGHDNAGQFFDRLRARCNISTITIPREAYGDWVDMRIWGNPSQKDLRIAQELLEGRMQTFFSEARCVIPVDESIAHWGKDQWQKQIKSWRATSNAMMIFYPPDWDVKNLVKEVWIFSDFIAPGKYNDTKRNVAERTIRWDLDKLKTEGVETSTEAVNADTGNQVEETWAKWRDPERDLEYWYREPDGFWFYINDRTCGWKRFHDAASNRYWWFCDSGANNGQWFFEP